MEQPICPTHGPMQKVPTGTPEQEWCGEWWRCELCTHSVLIPSAALQEMNDNMLRAFCEKEGWDFEATKAAGTPMTANA